MKGYKGFDKDLTTKANGWLKEDCPTIDAVPVVRCRECKHYNTIGCSKGFGWCENIDRGTSDNFYCANGEQLNKESEDD